MCLCVGVGEWERSWVWTTVTQADVEQSWKWYKETSVHIKPQGSCAPRDIELELAEQTFWFRPNRLLASAQA